MRLVVDTSASMAILLAEPEADRFAEASFEGQPVVSAGTLIEAHRVAFLRRGPDMSRELDRILELFGVDVVPVDREQVRLAEEGQRRFGRGRREPPAVLNFGDLFAYALARALDASLLFEGTDFRATDAAPAVE